MWSSTEPTPPLEFYPAHPPLPTLPLSITHVTATSIFPMSAASTLNRFRLSFTCTHPMWKVTVEGRSSATEETPGEPEKRDPMVASPANDQR